MDWPQVIELIKSPNWTEILKSVLGPIVGAVIAIATLWWKERNDRKREAQSWFEQQYILECIDPLIAHFIMLEALITDRKYIEQLETEHLSQKTFEHIPNNIIAKTEALLGSRIFLVSASFIQHLAMSKDSTALLNGSAVDVCLQLAKQYNVILHDLRKHLLTMRLKKKRDVYEVAGEPSISSVVEQMNKVHTNAAKKLGITYQTDENGRLLLDWNKQNQRTGENKIAKL